MSRWRAILKVVCRTYCLAYLLAWVVVLCIGGLPFLFETLTIQGWPGIVVLVVHLLALLAGRALNR